MIEYVKVNPGASAVAITRIAVTGATSTSIVSTATSAGTLEITASQRKIAEELEEQEWDAVVSQPYVQHGLNRLAAKIRQQIAAGETEEGGFAVE